VKLSKALLVLHARLKQLAYNDAEAVALRKLICAVLGVAYWEDALLVILRACPSCDGAGVVPLGPGGTEVPCVVCGGTGRREAP
jgi:hypothetical protein